MMLVHKRRIEAVHRELVHNDRLAYILLAALCVAVISIEAHEVFETNTIYNGYLFVKQTIEPRCTWDSFPYTRGGINWYVICVSHMAFGNSNVVPFMVSMGLVPVTFLFARKYSNNLIALLASLGLALNPVFLIFDSVSAYAQTWALFFIASLYLIRKIPILSAVTFNLSIFAKAIPMAWGPFIMYGVWRSGMNQKSKLILYAGVGAPLLILWSLSLFDGGSIVYGYMQLKPASYQTVSEGMEWIWTSYRWNELILFATPVLFGLYLHKRKKWALPSFPLEMLAVSNVIFLGTVFLTVEGSFPYRLVPNLVFFLFAASSLLYGGLIKNLKL